MPGEFSPTQANDGGNNTKPSRKQHENMMKTTRKKLTRRRSRKLGATGLAVMAASALSGFSQNAAITWLTPTTINSAGELDDIPNLYPGATLLQAGDWDLPANPEVVNTPGGQTISFADAAHSGSAASGTATELFFTGVQTGSTLYNGNTGNAAFNTVLQSDGWASGNGPASPQNLQIGGLTPGTLYAVQMLASDTRSTSASRTEQYQDNPTAGSGDDSASFGTASAVSVIGTFTATATDEEVYVIDTIPGAGPGAWDTTLSGFTVYAVPEPGTCALALGGLGMLLGLRARRKT
jgi:hypothetical protein